MLQLSAFHHLTAVSAKISQNLAFYTQTLGMRLVKKSVNQDDTTSYHLFYADGVGTPGTDVTFFDWPATPEVRGTRSVIRTGLRVRDRISIEWWQKHLSGANVKLEPITERAGRAVLDFEDPEGQRLSLVVDPTDTGSKPWEKSPIPLEHQILGLGPILMSTPQIERTEQCLVEVMNLRKGDSYWLNEQSRVQIFRMKNDGAAAELHVASQPHLNGARLGAGGVHHVAFRTTAVEYDAWVNHLNKQSVGNSGPIDRYYFKSLYFREPGGVLFEIATDEPGFAADEPMDTLGKKLALPPFLESQRGQIEAGLKPL